MYNATLGLRDCFGNNWLFSYWSGIHIISDALEFYTVAHLQKLLPWWIGFQ